MAAVRCRGPKKPNIPWTPELFDAAVAKAVSDCGGTYLPSEKDMYTLTLEVELEGIKHTIPGKTLATKISHGMGFIKLADQLRLPSKKYRYE